MNTTDPPPPHPPQASVVGSSNNSMSPSPPPPPQSASNSSSSAGGDNKSSTFAQTVKFVVFTGIAFSVIKSINPFDRRKRAKISQPQTTAKAVTTVDPTPIHVNEPLPVKTTTQPITQKPNGTKKAPVNSEKTIEVTSGDTLWGLSRKHGVSIDSIKQVNGLSGDTIHVGKKLIIP